MPVGTLSALGHAAADRYEYYHGKTHYLQDHFSGHKEPAVKGLSEAEKATIRQQIAKKSFETMTNPKLGLVKSPYSQRVIDWVNGRGPNPMNHYVKPGVLIEEMHFNQRFMLFFYLSVPIGFFWMKQNSREINDLGKDTRKMLFESYVGLWGSQKDLHAELPTGMGIGSQAIDFGFRRRYKVEREAFLFKKSIEKKVDTIAPWSNVRKEDAEAFGYGWDPRLAAESKSAKKMLAELEEAKKIGGEAARDEWVAHYKARFDAKKTLPRQWYSIFANLAHGEKHPVLLTYDELPYYAFTHRSSEKQDQIREMPEHPLKEWYHTKHHLLPMLRGSHAGAH